MQFTLLALALLSGSASAQALYYAPKCSPTAISKVFKVLKLHAVDANAVCSEFYTTARTTTGTKTAVSTITATQTSSKYETITATSTKVVKANPIKTVSYYSSILPAAMRMVKRDEPANSYLTMFPSADVKNACDCYMKPAVATPRTTKTVTAKVTNVIGTKTKTVVSLATVTPTTTIGKNACVIRETHTPGGNTYYKFVGRRGAAQNEIGSPVASGGSNQCWDKCNRVAGCVAAAIDRDSLCHFYSSIVACGVESADYLSLAVLSGHEDY